MTGEDGESRRKSEKDERRINCYGNKVERQNLDRIAQISKMVTVTEGYVMTWILGLGGGIFLFRLLFSFREILGLLRRLWRRAEDRFLYAHQTYKIPMYNDCLQENPLYRKAATYVGSLPSLEDSDNALLFSKKINNGGTGFSDLYLQLDTDQTVIDSFLGARVTWKNLSGEALVLRVRKRDRRRILRPYLQQIESVADEIELRRREVRLFTNSVVETGERIVGSGRRWKSVGFTHPSTMDTLAMDSELKNRVKADLEAFLKNKNYYHRLGRVWKRSYLLYGSPGTGKSSFVAAMAKFLSYDVYDLDLGRVSDGSDLKTLLLQTSSRSVIVVEDLDRYLQNSSGNSSVLSGVLNFMDGIFSCCGEERVMVFTMGEIAVSSIDPAVIRPGRLDVQLHFPLCDFTAFKTMASSYLGLKDHKLYPTVEEIFQNGASMSQAEIGEIMIANKGSPNRALKTLITALNQSSVAKRVSGLFGNLTASSSQKKSVNNSNNGTTHGNINEEQLIECSGGTSEMGGMLNKEFRKLYGLIKLRSGSKREESGAPPSNISHSQHQKHLSSSSLELAAVSSESNSKVQN